MTPLVSIIVPCHNTGNFLEETVSSVRSQILPDWELILIDDGSADNTWELIAKHVAEDSRIKGFQTRNVGTCRARNLGASKTDPSSPFLFFLDHDDRLIPAALAVMTSYLTEHPETGLLGCQFEDMDAQGHRLGTGKRSRWVPGTFLPRELEDREVETPFVTFFCATGQGPFAMYRRSVYEKTGGWETSFWPHEDTDMFCRMALLAPVHFLPDRLYLKRIHPAQGMSDGARIQRAYGEFRRKWDKMESVNPREATLLKEAKRHYYTRHKPCRDLKVATKTLRELIRDPNRKRFFWLLELLAHAVRGFLFTRV